MLFADNLNAFCLLKHDAARASYLISHPDLDRPEAVQKLCQESLQAVRIDLEKAERLSAAARWLADHLADPCSCAMSFRSAAHILHLKSEYLAAQELYEQALETFIRVGADQEAAITRSSAIGNLLFLGDQDRAGEWILAARSAFEQSGDRLRLARLESNHGTLLGRQDQWDLAIVRYQSSREYFFEEGNVQDVAVTLRNIAVCQIMRGRLQEAATAYQEAKAFCHEHGLTRLTFENEYNIAYLHFLRGELDLAFQCYDAVRKQSRELGDAYHEALCDLDEAEMSLELNLTDESIALATRAHASFDRIGIPYEAAKALAGMAIVKGRQRKISSALEYLSAARKLFIQEGNLPWQAWADFFQGFLLSQKGKYSEALALASKAKKRFSEAALITKAVFCDLLVADLLLRLGRVDEARKSCIHTLAVIGVRESPSLKCQAYLVLGRIEESAANFSRAFRAYRRSQQLLESLCAHLRSDHLRIAFLEDKSEVYESLVWLRLHGPQGSARPSAAFELVEKAKSRSFIQLLGARSETFPPKVVGAGATAARLQRLRTSLNGTYRQIDRGELEGNLSTARLDALRAKARNREQELLRALRGSELEDQEFTSLQFAQAFDLKTLQASLPQATVLLEYFIARGVIFLSVLTQDSLQVFRLGAARDVADLFRLHQHQLSRMAIPHPSIKRSAGITDQATQAHLEALYRHLILPVRGDLEGARHVVIVPHSFLHFIPFHALYDGEAFLIETFSVSFAPSAAVLHLSVSKDSNPGDRSLVLGIPDDRAPQILEEAHGVAELLGDARLLLGDDADEEALRRYGAKSKYLHIATHARFRHDNPMFSALQLGSGRLSLFDLYRLDLAADLVVLSGCGTGLSAVGGADELVGLARGILYAGARSTMVSLWDVNDQGTAQFMEIFYRHLSHAPSRAEALRSAMLDMKKEHPHPFFWAPFVLIGDPGLPPAG